MRSNHTAKATLSAVNDTDRAFQAANRNMEELSRNVRAVSKEFGKQADVYAKSESAMARLDKNVGKLTGSLKTLKGYAIGAAGLFAAGALSRSFQEVSAFGDKLDKLGKRLGSTADYLSAMRFAGEQSGVSFETFAMAMQRANRRIAEAAQGSGEAKNALKELGLNAQELNKLTLEQKFDRIADALADVENTSDRSRLAMKLFDSEGVALIQMLEDGSAGLRDLRDEAELLGIVMTDLEADKMAAMNDATNRMSKAFEGLKQTLVLSLAPAITTVADKITDWITGIDDLDKAQRAHKKEIKEVTALYNDNSEAARKNAEDTRRAAAEATRAAIARLEAERKTQSAFAYKIDTDTPANGGMYGPGPGPEAIREKAERSAGRIGLEINQLEVKLKELEKPLEAVAAKEKESGDVAEETEDKNNRLAVSYNRVASAARQTATRDVPVPVEKPWRLMIEERDATSPVPEFLKLEAAAGESHRKMTETAQQTAEDMAGFFKQSIGDSISDFENLGDIGESILKKLASNLLNSSIDGLFNSVLNTGGGAGILGGIGSIFGGFFADGGYLAPGKIGIAGEKGAEFISGGHSGVTVTPIPAGGGLPQMPGSGPQKIIVNVYGAKGDREIRDLVNSGVRTGLAEYDRNLPSRMMTKQARQL